MMAGCMRSNSEWDCEVPTQCGAQNRTSSTFANKAYPSSPPQAAGARLGRRVAGARVGSAGWQNRTHKVATQGNHPTHPKC